MKFSVIVPWYGRKEDRLQLINDTTACISRQKLQRDNFELVLVKDSDSLVPNLQSIADRVVTMPHRSLFNKSWFINTAARQIAHSWFFLLDADLLFDDCYFQAISNYMDISPTYVFVPFNDCKWMLEEGSSWITDYTKLDVFGLGFCIRKKEFFDTGGMCENFDGYGGEDGDIYERHKGLIHHMFYRVTHQYHSHADPTIIEDNQKLAEICRKHQPEIKKRQIAIKDQIGNPLCPTLITSKDLL